MDYSRAVAEGYKVWIALGAVLLAVGWAWIPRRAATRLLLVLTLVAGLNYIRFGTKLVLDQVDTYDLIHYYLNTRYFDELGYYDLYPACILADHEANGPYFKEGSKYMAQDENGHALKPISHALTRGAEVKQGFEPARWDNFKKDFLYLQRVVPGMNDELWRQMIQDHGFNGTPVWTMIATPFAQAPVQAIKLLCYLDIVLLTAGLLAVGRAFGASVGLWATLFLFLTYSTRWPAFTWAFLRYDYVAAMLFAMAALKRGRLWLAGLLTAWATALRLFPMMWLYGPLARGGGELLKRRIYKPLLVLLLGFGLGMGVLEGAAMLTYGPGTVVTHFSNMEDHNKAMNLSSRRIGLALALPFRGEVLPKNISDQIRRTVDEQKPLRFAIAGVMLVVLAWGLRKAPLDESYAFGFIPFFLLTTASYYYYVVRVTLIIAHAARLDRPIHRVGLAWLLGLELFSNWAETTWPEHRVFLVGYLAWGLAIYTVGMTLYYVWKQPEDQQDGATSQGAPAPSA